MEDVSAALENLIQKATNPKATVPDTAAVLEACSLLEREPYCAHIATRLIAAKIQSPLELEALRGLMVLDTCMKHCGVGFHAEVGKFRFLNEMIKLVSPKYLGARTPASVKKRVLQLMYSWTKEYPQESKIREAYEMLKKQGVVKEDPLYVNNQMEAVVQATPPLSSRPKNSVFEDEERSRLLQRLLQSKNPEDLQAANRLIKTMVKEDERRLELSSWCINELESVHNNVKLLSEMLDCYRPGQTSQEELELIKELHQSCERLRPTVFRLATEMQDNESLLNRVLSASDELGQVFDKYTTVIIKGEVPSAANNTSLLDLSTPSEEKLPPVPSELIGKQLANLGLDLDSSNPAKEMVAAVPQSNMEVLGDIFGRIENVSKSAADLPVLQPVSVQQQQDRNTSPVTTQEKPSKLKALEDLDALGESLLKQSLPTTFKIGSQFSKPAVKVPMNSLNRLQEVMKTDNASSLSPVVNSVSESLSVGLDLDFLTGEPLDSSENKRIESQVSTSERTLDPPNGDDSMVDLTEEISSDVIAVQEETNVNKSNVQLESGKGLDRTNVNSVTDTKPPEVKSLNDISVSLDSIKPGSVPPLTVLDEKNGISVILHFAKDRPREDVSVIVVTTISKNHSALSNYQFQAVVPKTCKLKLQSPSGSELPAHNPFLPPSAITQVMLIANPRKDPVSLKFMISYTMDDDTITEMGEVEKLPLDI